MSAPVETPAPAPAPPAREAFRAALSRSIQAAPTSIDALVEDESPRLRVEDDRKLLKELLAKDAGETRDIGGPYVDEAENLFPNEREAFPDMLDRLVQKGRPLTDKQRDWVYRTAVRMNVRDDELMPVVPRGREVETPAVLRTLPLAPPGRNEPCAVDRVIERRAERKAPTREAPCPCGAKIGYGGFHYPGAQGCRSLDFTRRTEPHPAVVREFGQEAAGLIKQAADLIDEAAMSQRFGPQFGFTQPPEVLPPEDVLQPPTVLAEPDDLAFIEPMAKNLGLPEYRVRAAYERALVQVQTSVITQTANGTRRIFRTLEGDLDNCARIHGEPEKTCPNCSNNPGGCPDKDRIKRLLNQYLHGKTTPENSHLGKVRMVDTGEQPTPFDLADDDGNVMPF